MKTYEDVARAWCVKCRDRRLMNAPAVVPVKNGNLALEGKCPVCGTRMFRNVYQSYFGDPGRDAKKREIEEVLARGR